MPEQPVVVSLSRKTFLASGLLGLCMVALGLWGTVWSITTTPRDILFSALAFAFAAAGAGVIWRGRRHIARIYADRIEIEDGFGTRVIGGADIVGTFKGSARDGLRLFLRDGTSFVLVPALAEDRGLKAWLKTLPDAKVRHHRSGRVRTMARAINALGWIVAAWVLFVPMP